MSKPSITLVAKDYDHFQPIASGDVQAADIDFTIDRDTAQAVDRVTADSSIQVGELSFARHVARIAGGDRSWVGIPVFPTRVFRHRAIFVRRDGGVRTIKDLDGARLGISEWPASGSTWSRAALREQGVRIDSCRWWVGTYDGSILKRPQGTLPPHAQMQPEGRGLQAMLLEGEIDALIGPEPAGLNAPDSPIVRLFEDYRRAEREYYERTGIFPAHHIIGVRQELFQQMPRVVRSIFNALEESKQRWHAQRRKLADTSPWLQADLDEAEALMGSDWFPYGLDANRALIQTFCDELDAQGLTARPVGGAEVFAEFEEVMQGNRATSASR